MPPYHGARAFGSATSRIIRRHCAIRNSATIAACHGKPQLNSNATTITCGTAITAQRGQGVSGNQALASILPAGSELEAELYVPSRSAGFVKSGMEVLLRYQAFPFQKFGQFRGVVREVSGTSLRPDDIGEPRAVGSAAEPLYRVRVALERQTVTAYGAEQNLRSGMAIDASVLLDRRRLYEWVLEPLYSISGRS